MTQFSSTNKPALCAKGPLGEGEVTKGGYWEATGRLLGGREGLAGMVGPDGGSGTPVACTPLKYSITPLAKRGDT